MLRGFSPNPPPLMKGAKNTAQVSRIQCQLFAHLRSRGLLAMSEFIKHADFGQGQRTVKQPFLQNTDLSRVEAIEAPDGLNALTEFVGSGSAACHEISVGPMIDFVNYIVAIESTRFGTNKNARDHPRAFSNQILYMPLIRCAYPVPSESSPSAHSRLSALLPGHP